MNLKLLLRRAAAGALCLGLCLAVLTGPAHAAMRPVDDLDRECSLTVKYLHEGKTVRLYRVAGVSDGYMSFMPEEQFKPLLEALQDDGLKDLNKIGSDSDWRRLAKALDLEILKRGGIESCGETKTERVNGDVLARFDGIEPGLYLAVGERYSVTEKQDDGSEKTVWYGSAPYLVCLPHWSETDDAWQYDVAMDASGKMSESVDEKISIKVLKLWLTSDGRPLANHPNKVTINLLRDGEVYDTVELNESGWSKVWEGLDSSHRWDIEEPRVSGYNVRVESDDGRNFTVENRKKPTRPGGGGPNDPSDDPPDDITIEDPDVPLSVPPIEDLPPITPPDEIEIDDPDVPLSELPQTGQLWWPVPMLAVGGTFLLLLGWGRNRRGRYNGE